jgi:hypothetical protein
MIDVRLSLLLLGVVVAVGPVCLGMAGTARLPLATVTATAGPTVALATAKPVKPLAATQVPLFEVPAPTARPWCTVRTPGGDVLNLRAGPGMEAEILRGLLPGDVLWILASSGEWLQVESLDGQKAGWVLALYCEVRK